MKKQGIHLFMALLLVCGALLACSHNSDKYDNEEGRRQLFELGKIMGVKFPPGSKIVYVARDERGKEAASEHIVYSPSPAKFNRPPVAKISSESISETLRKTSFTKDLEKLKNKWTYCYEGIAGKGSWSAYQINIETGSYLRVEQVFLYWQTDKN